MSITIGCFWNKKLVVNEIMSRFAKNISNIKQQDMASTTLKGNTQTSVSKPLFGPTSIDEAIKRVENAEKLTGTTLEDFVAELKNEQLW